MSIYKCPCCGEKSFNPILKARAGRMNQRGVNCPSCGKRVVNGRGATIFNAIFSVLGLACMVLVFLFAPDYQFLSRYEVVIQLMLLVSIHIVPRIVNAFCFKLTEAIRIESV